MNNHGNYAASLGNLCRWLAQQAEALGVEIYPGFAASEALFREDGSLRGVVAGVMGLDKQGQPNPTISQVWNSSANMSSSPKVCAVQWPSR